MADAIVINKSDGSNVQKAKRAQAEFSNALHLFPPSESGWIPQVRTCSSIYNDGIEEVWNMVLSYKREMDDNGFLATRRQKQAKYWMFETIREGIFTQVFNDPGMKVALEEYEKAIAEGKITSFMAAQSILKKYKS
jgi:LAO/AO transport system kinase